MADKTHIQWTDASWNVVTGCTRVSEGCRHCYIERTPAFRMAGRKFVNGKIQIEQHIPRLNQPLKWKKPRRVFVNSLSDLFHEDIEDSFILNVFTVMAICHRHTFQILTKRPRRMQALLSKWRADDLYLYWHGYSGGPAEVEAYPLKNVWLGVSIEDQATADERIPILLKTPAAVRFISAEPLLGPVDVSRWMKPVEVRSCWEKGYKPTKEDYAAVAEMAKASLKKVGKWNRLDWIICGGESGPGARLTDLAWMRSLKDQCQAAKVPVFVKQLGAKPYRAGRYANARVFLHDKKGGDPQEWPDDLRVREYP